MVIVTILKFVSEYWMRIKVAYISTATPNDTTTTPTQRARNLATSTDPLSTDDIPKPVKNKNGTMFWSEKSDLV